MTRTGINWDAQPLGKVSDAELARRNGVSAAAVFGARKRRGIKIEGRIDWDSQPLGQISDSELATKLGVSQSAVSQQRAHREIARFGGPGRRPKCDPLTFAKELDGSESDRVIAERHGLNSAQVATARRAMKKHPKRIRWDMAPLGTAPDYVVQESHGGGKATGNTPARRARLRLGIPKWSRSQRRQCPCGEAFNAFHMRQRFCSHQCQRYHWQLVNVRPKVAPEVADCMLAIWRYKRTLKKGHLKHVG